MELLPILQDFIPYLGRCPKSRDPINVPQILNTSQLKESNSQLDYLKGQLRGPKNQLWGLKANLGVPRCKLLIPSAKFWVFKSIWWVITANLGDMRAYALVYQVV